MRKLAYIWIVVFCAFSAEVWAQDYARLSERTIAGTARYVGMAGAMTAVGADPSAALDNPAGLGLYRRAELLVTADYMRDRTTQVGADRSSNAWALAVPQVSWVLSFPTTNLIEKGAQFHNLMFSYRLLHTYNRSFDALAGADKSLGALVATTEVDLGMDYCADRCNKANSLILRESGNVSEYAIDWAMNISNQWYVGLGVHMQTYSLMSEAVYEEVFDAYNIKGEQYYNRNNTTLIFSGVSANLSAGLLYRPTGWLRMGLAFQTPSWGSITTYSEGLWTARKDTVGQSYAPDLTGQAYDYHMPWKTSTSVAFQWGKIGMLALQYDYLHRAGQDDIHALKAGMEIVPIAGFFINAGYAFESTFKAHMQPVPMDYTFERQDTYYLQNHATQYASISLGYRGKRLIAQAAYQYRWQNVVLGAHESAMPYYFNADTHKIVLTLGWHRSN